MEKPGDWLRTYFKLGDRIDLYALEQLHAEADRLDTRELIENFRGGVPSKCDFCQKETPPEQLEPEEAGDWVCHECLDRWHKEEVK